LLSTNIVVPSIVGKSISMHFLPDQLLIRSGKQYSGLPYAALTFRTHTTRFIESDRVPRDATQVGQTWQYANVRGGPDRRFKNNRQLPIMSYAELEVTGAGLKLVWQFSNVAATTAFHHHIRVLANVPAAQTEGPPTTAPSPPAWHPDPSGKARLRWWDGNQWTEHVS
jgi:hypothetical protein